MRIVAELIDGTKHITETSLWQCLADQFAFRDHFGRSYLSLSKVVKDAEGDVADVWDERWTAFFIWRCLRRSGTSPYEGDFTKFLENVARYDVIVPDAEKPEDTKAQEIERPDPTEPSSATTSTETTSSLPTLQALTG